MECCRGSDQTKLRLVEERCSPFCMGGALVTSSKLEQWLTKRLAVGRPQGSDSDDHHDEEDEDVVWFAIRYDAHWLKCRPLRAGPLMTILGIYEDEGNPHVPVQTSYWRVVMDDDHNDHDENGRRGASCCGCHPLHSEWKRRPTTIAVSNEDSSSPVSYCSSQPYRLQWLDFRSMTNLNFLSTPERAWHFLTSLLGNHHWQNPWVESTEEDATPQMIGILLPHSCSKLRDFRVSDACPAWFFHGYAYLDDDSLGDDHGPAVLYMYKRLKPRVRLSPTHPPGGDTASVSVIPGCLWEMVPPKDDENEEGREDTKETAAIPEDPTYRLVSPPYLNLEQEYGSQIAQGLFSSQAVGTFRQEALNIPQWTPWPETQHYSVGPNGEVTWTVFPLCYCFPSKDVSQRTWVEETRRCCPQTCALLESVLGDTLRTALFSQLKPQTVLEAHVGWADLANDVYRLHIPLVLPDHSYLCGTWVDGCVETHQVGRPLLFDDSKIHRAFNYHSTESRIVLIVDLARPSTLPPGTAVGGHSDELDQFISQMSLPK